MVSKEKCVVWVKQFYKLSNNYGKGVFKKQGEAALGFKKKGTRSLVVRLKLTKTFLQQKLEEKVPTSLQHKKDGHKKKILVFVFEK